MFWSLHTPMAITAAAAIGFVVAAFVLIEWRGWNPLRTLKWVVCLAVVLFVPSCCAVKYAVDAYRFGDFTYASAADGRGADTEGGDATFDPQVVERWFGPLGWDLAGDCIPMEGPCAANGAGFAVWYSPSRRVAYLMAHYW